MPGSILETFFIKLDGIVGESVDSKHKEQIELVSFSWGATQTGRGPGGGGGGAGKAQIKEFEFLMRVNKASPQVFLALVSGRHLKEASLSVTRGAAKAAFDWLKIKFTDVLITSYEQAGDEDPPHELVAFDFARVEMTVTPQTAKGGPGTPVTVGWDLKKNAKL
jgi:type VI secretion system secreted protein Hcp